LSLLIEQFALIFLLPHCGLFHSENKPARLGKHHTTTGRITMQYENIPPTLDELTAALNFVDPNMCRDDWVRVLMGIKNEFGDNGRDAAENWSKGGDTYNKDNFKTTWKDSIKPGGGVTIATVFKLAVDNGYKPEQKELTAEQIAKFKHEQEVRAKERAEQEARAEAERVQWHNTISGFALQILEQFTISIKSNKYLTEKKVDAFGVFGIKAAFIAVVRPNFVTEVITGGSDIKRFFDSMPAKEERDFSFLHIKRGDLVIPLIDVDRKVWNVQIINASGTKLFLKHGRKSGCFHFIGDVSNVEQVAVCEGYATGATIHMATSWPCAVALDAGNLKSVATQLKRLLPEKQFILCADDDSDTKGNPGITKANEAAAAVAGLVAVPDFTAVQAEAA